MKKSAQIFLVLFFMLIIVVPAVWMLAGKGGLVTVGENRALAEFPPLRTVFKKSFYANLDKYLNDHYGLRSELLWLRGAQIKFLRTSTSPAVVIGKEGWLFFSGESNLEDYRNTQPFGDDELRAWVDYVVGNSQRLAKLGVQYLFVIAPNAHSVYGDLYLPEWVKKVAPLSRREILASELHRRGVRVVDPTEVLRGRRLERRIYHKTDTHWTPLGAFYGYQEMMKALGRPALTLEKFSLETLTATRMDLTRMLGPFDIFEEYLAPKFKDPPRANSVPARNKFTHSPDILSHCPRCPGRDRALIFQDSFFTAMAPYFSEHFVEARYRWQYFVDWEEVHSFRPQVVVEEVVERHLLLAPPSPVH